MVDIAPFRALRSVSKKNKSDVSSFICPPYDVVSPHERESLVKRCPQNVIEIELPAGMDNEKFANAGRILNEWRSDGLLQEDRSAAYYLLETTYKIADPFAPKSKQKRYGVLSALRLETPGKGAVHPHEKTLPKAKEERLNLITALRTDVSPIFGLFFDPKKQWEKWLKKALKQKPLVKGKEKKDLEHRMWKIDDPALQKELREILKAKDLYIADGHHRYEVAWAYSENRLKDEPNAPLERGYRRVMAYVCPMEEKGLLMLPTHRLVNSTHTLTEWQEHLSKTFDIKPVKRISDLVKALTKPKGTLIGWIHADGAALLKPKAGIQLDRLMPGRPAALRALDVVLLHDVAMGEAMNPPFMESKEIIFTRDIDGMKTLAEKDPSWVGFVLSSPGVASLARVAEANEVMPPKTTYFYPKVPTGFTLMHLDQNIA